MTLTERLDARLDTLDIAYRKSMEAALAHLRRSGMDARSKRVGERAPDFTLPDRFGKPTTLSVLLEQGPVVLSFYRGEWCSFCRLEMDALIEILPRMRERGAQLVMVSPQGPTEALLNRTSDHDGLIILKDQLNGVGLQYGLVFRMPDMLRHALLAVGIDLSHIYGTDSWFLPIPATYVISRKGIVAMAHVDPDFTRRLEPGIILEALVDLS